MTRVIGDSEIERLIAEPKPLPRSWRASLKLQSRAGELHQRAKLNLQSDSGRLFRASLRQSNVNPFDFSMILTFIDTDGKEYRLTRFNGRHSSQHTNLLKKRTGEEHSSFRNKFHKHIATERYQFEEGLDIDGYAEVTDKYESFKSALTHFCQTCGFYSESDLNRPLLPQENGEGL